MIEKFDSLRELLVFINNYLVEGSTDYTEEDYKDGLSFLGFSLVD
jgi:hypothetical protein